MASFSACLLCVAFFCLPASPRLAAGPVVESHARSSVAGDVVLTQWTPLFVFVHFDRCVKVVVAATAAAAANTLMLGVFIL